MYFLGTVLAMAGQSGGTGGGQGNWYSSLLPLVAIFGIFYFLMIRPQQKQQKKHRDMLAAMKKGDKVVTRGGIHGTIHGITDNIITLEVSENMKIKLTREAIASIQPQS